MFSRKKFCCSDSSRFYEDYYVRQSGGDLSGFEGALYQRGYGLGSLFRGLFRSALPLVKSGLKKIGKEALRSGAIVAGDIISGQTPKDAVVKRMTALLNKPQTGSGIRRRKRQKKQQLRMNTKRRRTSVDIFD
jgi:hypothetical protein